MNHVIQRIDVGSFEQQYQDIIRPYLLVNHYIKDHPGSLNLENTQNHSPEPIKMIIDLVALEHINSLILAFLLTLKRWAVLRQISYQIINMPKHLEGLADVYGIAELLGIDTESS